MARSRMETITIRLGEDTVRKLDELLLRTETRAEALAFIIEDYTANIEKYSQRFTDKICNRTPRTKPGVLRD